MKQLDNLDNFFCHSK